MRDRLIQGPSQAPVTVQKKSKGAKEKRGGYRRAYKLL